MNTRMKICKCSNCEKYFKIIIEDTCISGERGEIYTYQLSEEEQKNINPSDIGIIEDMNPMCPYCKLLAN